MDNMLTIKSIIALIILLPLSLFTSENGSVCFDVGEKLEYSVWLNFIKGGNAYMTVSEIDTIDGSPVFHFISKTNSSGVVDKIFKVREHIESWFDCSKLISRKYYKNIQEGKYRKQYSVNFNYLDQMAYSDSDTLPFVGNMLDGLSMIYYIRSQDLFVGQNINISVYDNDKLKNYKVLVVGKKTI